MTDADFPVSFAVRPIGVVHSPFNDRVDAPRQPRAGGGADGSIELFAASGIEHALEDLTSFRFIWVLFWFHKNSELGFRPKVRPPRSLETRGLFATRAPYRPNPIGMSPLELLRIEGRILHVRDIDMLDGTPVIDIKPYVPYVDSIPDANSGWLEDAERPSDPLPPYHVEFSERALEALHFLSERGVVLRERAERSLSLGPSPHPYRRIKQDGDGFLLGLKEWRLTFVVDAEARRVSVTRVQTGIRPRDLYETDGEDVAVHREFVAKFGL